MIELLKKYKRIIVYGIFGVLTTIVNVTIYHTCYEFAQIGNVLSTVIAWFFAVVFAYITNKLFVFESKAMDTKTIISEAFKFFSCRIGTGIIEVGFMAIFVDILAFDGTIMKLITNIVVIVLNYILSKLVIFKKGMG